MDSSSETTLSSPPRSLFSPSPCAPTRPSTRPSVNQRETDSSSDEMLSSPPRSLFSPSIHAPSSPVQTPTDSDLSDSITDSDLSDSISDSDESSDDNTSGCDSSDSPCDGAMPRRHRAEKLQEIVSTLRRLQWTFKDMVEAWVGVDGQHVRIEHRRYGSLRGRRKVFKKAVESVAWHGLLPTVSERVRTQCAKELDVLLGSPPFGKFTVDMQLNQINFKDGTSIIQSTAPTWFKLIRSLLGNRRKPRPSYLTHNTWKKEDPRVFTITSMICFSRARITSNTMPSCLDVYLVGSGVPRRVIQTLAGLGLCHSYHHANTLMMKVAAYAKVRNSR